MGERRLVWQQTTEGWDGIPAIEKHLAFDPEPDRTAAIEADADRARHHQPNLPDSNLTCAKELSDRHDASHSPSRRRFWHNPPTHDCAATSARRQMRNPRGRVEYGLLVLQGRP
jgi:hypothetical protein